MTTRHFPLLLVLLCAAGVLPWLVGRSQRPHPGTPPTEANPSETNQSLATEAPSGFPLATRNNEVVEPPRYRTNGYAQPLDNDTTASLVLLLNSGTETEKREAARRLGKLGTPQATQALLSQLDSENSIPVRLALLAALSDVPPGERLDLLISCLGDSKKYDVRDAVRTTLKQNASPESINKLLAAVRARQDDQWFVRDVAKIFRGYSNPQLVPSLSAELSTSAATTESEMCAEALANIGTPGATAALVEAAVSASGERRTALTRAISHVTRPDGVQELAQANVPPTADDVRIAITTAVLPLSGHR